MRVIDFMNKMNEDVEQHKEPYTEEDKKVVEELLTKELTDTEKKTLEKVLTHIIEELTLGV